MGETKRKMLTPAQRVAKAEADLAAAKKAAEVKGAKRGGVLIEQRAKLIEQINDRKSKVDAIEAELEELGIEIDDHSQLTLVEDSAATGTEG